MAQTQIFSRRTQVFVTPETTVDTFVAPSGGDAFLAEDVSFSMTAEEIEDAASIDGFLRLPSVVGKKTAEISFRVAFRGNGATGPILAPDFADALKASGLAETSSGAPVDTIGYAPVSTFDGVGGNPAQSYSVSVIIDGNRYSISGAFADLSLEVDPGKPLYLSFRFSGRYVDHAADALKTTSYDSSIPPTFLGAASFTTNFGGAFVPVVRGLRVELGNQIAIGDDATKTAGVYGARITGRAPRGSMIIEAPAQATKDFYALVGTIGSVDTGQVGAAGNGWRLYLPYATIVGIEHQDFDGVLGYSVEMQLGQAATATEGGATNDFLLEAK